MGNHSPLLALTTCSLPLQFLEKIGKMFRKISLVCVAFLVAQIYAQHKGTLTEEKTLDLPYSTCTSSGCTEQKGGVTMDGNWRWTHKVGEPTNCYTGNEWDQELCADAASCTETVPLMVLMMPHGKELMELLLMVE